MAGESDRIITFATEQEAALKRASEIILDRIDFNSILNEAGVDLAGTDTVTIEFSSDVDEVGALKKKRPGDGNGCITICIGWGPARICWKNCDD